MICIFMSLVYVFVQKKKKKLKLAASLSKCVNYVQSVHFDGFENAVTRKGENFINTNVSSLVFLRCAYIYNMQ